jgi:hypothetical protein
MLNDNNQWVEDYRDDYPAFNRPYYLQSFLKGEITTEEFLEEYPKFSIYLDDIRQTPSVTDLHCFSVTECKKLIETGCCIAISLDNNLGDTALEGWKLMDWLENSFTGTVPTCCFHTGSPAARKRMQEIWERIVYSRQKGDNNE